MYITALALIAKNWKSTQCPSTGRNLNSWHIHGMQWNTSPLINDKKKWTINTYNHRGEFQKSYAKWKSGKKMHTVWFHLYKILEKQRNLQGQKADQWLLSGDGREKRFRKPGRRIAKGHEETLGSHRYVHYLECNVSSPDVHVCEIFSNYIL